MRTTSRIVSCVLVMVGCSDPGPGGSSSGEAGGGGAPGVTSAGATGGSGSGGDPSGTGGSGSGGDPSGTGGSGSGGDPSGTGGSGSGGDPSGTGGSGSGGDPSGTGGSGGSGGTGGTGGTASLSPCGTPTTWRSSPEAFLDLGHTQILRRLFVSGDRVLGWDHDRWILWDTATRAAIADGNAPGGFRELPFPLPDGSFPELPGGVELRADLLVIQTDPQHAFELRNAADGSLLAAISAEYDDVGLATDGSYVWAARSRNITVWSRTGDEVLSATLEVYGEFHAAPDAVRVASKYHPDTSVQVVPIDGSPPHLTPAFAGTFHAWSRDGARFLTTAGNTVRVYSRTGVHESIVNLPHIDNLAATGGYLWTYNPHILGNPLTIYRIGGGNVPVAQYEYRSGMTVVPSERAIGVFGTAPTKLEVFDLGGSEITRAEHEVTVYPPTVAHIDGGLRWAIGSSGGVILQKGTVADPDATGKLGCGASKLGGAASGQVAIATPAGAIFLYDTADLGAGPTASVPLLSAGVRLSADGRVLAARATERDSHIESRDLRIFSLPDGAEVASFDSDVALLDFSLSASGTTLGRTYHRSNVLDGDRRIVSDVSGATVIYEDTGSQPVPVISPDGRHYLVTDEATGDGCGFTQFYEDGVLVNAVPGCAVGWLDDTRALVQTYTRNFLTNRWELQASTLYDELGNVIATPPLPRITLAPKDYTVDYGKPAYGMVPVSPTAIHARYERAIYDIKTGATLATLPEASVIAGSSVVYPCGNAICAAPY
ncbi:hypothetical protein WMF11_34955 [Sorangium sp. So ce295]|uniref:hypothetical protein n=1 Tax=Sorangium sp. So ce295 TaxID=3133295 RepID=UPI003F5F2FBD